MDAALPPLRAAGPAPRDAAKQDPAPQNAGPPTGQALERAARAFEATFIAEMLKHSGAGKAPDSFGGGIGEEQFASLLREAQAREMAKAGGIGLAEFIVAALGENLDER